MPVLLVPKQFYIDFGYGVMFFMMRSAGLAISMDSVQESESSSIERLVVELTEFIITILFFFSSFGSFTTIFLLVSTTLLTSLTAPLN